MLIDSVQLPADSAWQMAGRLPISTLRMDCGDAGRLTRL